MTEDQTYMFKLLRVFRELCEKHQLRYFLMGGTLLGAVRHKGFIPWDDDADVAMLLDDYLKFTALTDEFPENVKIQSGENDPQYPFVFIKLYDSSHPFFSGFSNHPKGVYIDIFPLIPSKELNQIVKLRFDIIHVTDYVLQVKLGWAAFIPYKLPAARIGFWLLNHFSPEVLKKIRRKQIEKIYDRNTYGTLCSPGGIYKPDKEFYPIEWFSEDEKVSFEGEQFSAPIGWNCYLQRNYGSYMELPPPEERRTRHKTNEI